MNTRRVRTLTKHGVATVQPGTWFTDIVDIMATERVNALPVVDAAGHVVGVVSEADLLRTLVRTGTAGRAADLMTAPAVTVSTHATVTAAARLMQQHRVERLPVIGDDGRFLGVVSRRDLLAAYVRTDEDIRADVRANVLMRDLSVEPDDLTVTVHNGLVTLAGTVDRRSTARITDRLVRAVTGVVDVANHLRWEHDDSRPKVPSVRSERPCRAVILRPETRGDGPTATP